MTEDEENEFIMRIRHKCRIAVLRYHSASDQSTSQEMRDKDWRMFLKNREEVIVDSAQLTDDFSQGFALHSVVDMLTATGEDQLARETLATIRDESIKEKATADFLAGPQACYNNLIVPSKEEVESDQPISRAPDPRPSVIKSLSKKIAAAVPVVALIAAYGLFVPVGSLGRQWIDNFTASDADIRARLEAGFTNGSKTFQALKQFYPNEYESLITTTISDARSNLDSAEMTRQGAEFTNKLRKENSGNYQMVGVERMREHLKSTVPLFEYVKTRYGVQACNQMSIGGGVALIKVIGSAYNTDKPLIALFDESSALFFRIAAEGKTLRLKHVQPTDADWGITLQSLLDGGMTQDEINMVAEAEKHEGDPLLCDATLHWLRGIIELKGDSGQRVIPFIAGEMAKS